MGSHKFPRRRALSACSSWTLVGRGLVAPSLAALAAAACGSPPPPAPPKPPTPIVADKKEVIDLSPVPEPATLIALGRVKKPEAILTTARGWVPFVPPPRELISSITSEGLADVIDLASPVDAAVTVSISRRGPVPMVAFAVHVSDFDQARVRLGERYKLAPAGNGTFKVSGLSSTRRSAPMAPGQEHEDQEDEDEDVGCVLSHASKRAGEAGPKADSARLVCGSPAGLEALVPYLTRTMPKAEWPADVHVEVRPEPIRAPLTELRSQLPILARGIFGAGQSNAFGALLDAGIGELVDVINDTDKLSLDGMIADRGIKVTTRVDYSGNRSALARMTTMTDRTGPVPPAFFRLPVETDLAFYGQGSDAKLFEHPRELIAALLVEAADSAGLPAAERSALKDLVAEKMLALVLNSGPAIYAKGYNQEALLKAQAAKEVLKTEDVRKNDDALMATASQLIGWHLYQTSEPIAKVGPILKDWSTLFNRPAFAKWIKDKAHGPEVPRMRIAPMPAGVTLPKESVHLEISITRADRHVMPASTPSRAPDAAKKLPKAPAPKTVKVAPVVFHVFAVPDGGATWLAFGMDAKLVASRAAAVLVADAAGSLAKTAGLERLHDGKLNGGGFATFRALGLLAGYDGEDKPFFSALPMIPNKGETPIVFFSHAEGPSATAKVGSVIGEVDLPRGTIEDAVKFLFMPSSMSGVPPVVESPRSPPPPPPPPPPPGPPPPRKR